MKYTHITISREHGSGGRLIAEQVAKGLSIPLYDKKTIQAAAAKSSFSANCMEGSESRTASLLYNIYINSQATPVNDQAFMAQANAINKLSKQGRGVFLGSCFFYSMYEICRFFNEKTQGIFGKFHKNKVFVRKNLLF